LEQIAIAVTILTAIQTILAWILKIYIHDQLLEMKLEIINRLQDAYASKERVLEIERRVSVLETKVLE